MQKINYPFLAIIAICIIFLSSCEVVGGIFKAGVWTGLLLVAVVIAVVIWIIARMRK